MSGESKMVLQDQSSSLPKGKLLLLFFGLQMSLLMSFIDSTSVSTILPTIAQDLDAANSIVWAGTAFLVANTSFQIITSRLSDCFGRKVVLLASLVTFAAGDLLAGFATNKEWLYMARAIAGIGGGGINSLTMIIVSDVLTVRERGKYLTLLGIGIATGSAAGPFLGAAFAKKASWSWVFWIMAPFATTIIILVQFTVPQKKMEGGIVKKLKSMDWLGSIMSLTMTASFLVPLSGGGSTFKWLSPVVISLFVVAVLALLSFVWVEARYADHPLIPGRILLNRNVCLIITQTWLVGVVYYGGIYFIPLYLQNILNASPIASAALLLPLLLSQVVTTSISGYVINHTGKAWSSITVGFVVWTAGQGAQLCFDAKTPNSVIVTCLLIQGLGIGATIQSTLVLAQAWGERLDRAAITGARNFARTSGGAVGLAIANTILQNAFINRLPVSLPAELKNNLHHNFYLPEGLDESTRQGIKSAYMTGLRQIFVFFVPVVGVCLTMCLFIRDLPPDLQPPSILPSATRSLNEDLSVEIELFPAAQSSVHNVIDHRSPFKATSPPPLQD